MRKLRLALDSLPASRTETVFEHFANADNRVREIIEKHSDALDIRSCKKVMNYSGEFVSEISHYSETDRAIFMDETKDNEEYAITFCHEYGHYIDSQLSRPSLCDEFSDAINADFDQCNPESTYGLNNLNNMLDSLRDSDALNSRYLSDIFSGMFHNEQRIVDTYYDEGMPFYHHSNEYWDGIDGPPQAPAREIFANLFAIYTENDSETVRFVERYLPNTTARFNLLLGGD